jgi:hypothetical protein
VTSAAPSPVPTEHAADGGAALPPEPERWHTGSAIDEFTPIYLALSRATKLHGAIAPSEVDALDLTVVAALLGVGGLDGGDFDSASRDLIRRRAAAMATGADFSWEDG